MNKFLQTMLISVILIVCMGCNVFIPISPTHRPTVDAIATPALQQESHPKPQQALNYININEIISSEMIKEFLIEKIGASAYGGKVFCAYQIIGTEQENQTIKIYLWVLVQEYYVAKQSMLEGAATSEPVAVFVIMRNGTYQISGYRDAGEGYQ